MTNTLVYPGDFIANSEEFMPGAGTHVEGGKVVASVFGSVNKDLEKREVSVKSNISQPDFHVSGLTVVGVVEKVSDKLAFLSLLPSKEGNHRYVTQDAPALIKVANVKQGFVKNVKDEFRVGDIVRAKITNATADTVDLTTNGDNLGVIKAFCTKCRQVLDKNEQGVVCSHCGWRTRRHTAADYRSGNMVN